MNYSKTGCLIFWLFVLAFFMGSVSVSSQNPDIDLLRKLNSGETLPSDKYMTILSDTHREVCVAIPLTLGIAGLITKDKDMVNKSIEIVAASAINLGFTYIIKSSVNRERPFETYPDIVKKSDGGSPSFPSGHTSSVFATATSLSLNYPKWYVIAPSYLWAGAVGYSRMQLGVHYPSDVLAGALLGAGSAWLTYKANKWIQKKYINKHGIPN